MMRRIERRQPNDTRRRLDLLSKITLCGALAIGVCGGIVLASANVNARTGQRNAIAVGRGLVAIAFLAILASLWLASRAGASEFGEPVRRRAVASDAIVCILVAAALITFVFGSTGSSIAVAVILIAVASAVLSIGNVVAVWQRNGSQSEGASGRTQTQRPAKKKR
jgi:hypothetical protein